MKDFLKNENLEESSGFVFFGTARTQNPRTVS